MLMEREMYELQRAVTVDIIFYNSFILMQYLANTISNVSYIFIKRVESCQKYVCLYHISWFVGRMLKFHLLEVFNSKYSGDFRHAYVLARMVDLEDLLLDELLMGASC